MDNVVQFHNQNTPRSKQRRVLEQAMRRIKQVDDEQRAMIQQHVRALLELWGITKKMRYLF